jgi:hypothetical protein
MFRRLLPLVLVVAGTASASGPWTDLGFALPGALGLPHLECSGPLTPDSGLSIGLSNAKLSTPAYLVVGFSAIYAPYKGGVLVPDFDLLLSLWTNLDGGVHASAHWPGGAPSGFTIYLQFWINDEAAVAGRAGSNAVMGVVP